MGGFYANASPVSNRPSRFDRRDDLPDTDDVPPSAATAPVFPPPHTVRLSARARRARLVIAPATGLVVVLPRGMDPRLVPELLASRREWIEQHLRALREAADRRGETRDVPERVVLAALGQTLRVRYRPGGAKARARRTGLSTLEVRGAIADREAAARALRAWLMREAKAVLPDWLADEARRLGLRYARVRVGRQRTRWGSCSAAGVVSLNAALLFLPRELAGYVLAHELAHTVHLNHSQAFWTLLDRLCPGCRDLDRRLRRARDFVPGWVAADSPLCQGMGSGLD